MRFRPGHVIGAFGAAAAVLCVTGGSAWAGAPLESKIAFITTRDSGEIYTMEADGSGEARVTRRAPSGFGSAWSPGGARIAFTGSADDGSRRLWVMSQTGSGLRRITNLRAQQAVGGPAFDPDWSPSGRRLVFSYGFDIYTVRADGSGRRRLTDRGGSAHDDWDPAWSPNGRVIVFTRDGRLYRMRPNGRRLRLLGRGDEADWSPSARRIVFTVEQRNGRGDLFVMKADGSDRRRLTRTRANESRPAWAPSGRTIAFGRRNSLWTIDPDGSDARRIVGSAREPAWSPAGTFLAFSRGRSGEHVGEEEGAFALFRMRRDGTGVTRLLTPEFDRDVAPSPDGTRIAFTSVRPFSQSGVYVADAGGTNESFVHGGESPAWSPDSAQLILRDADGLYTLDADGSNATRLAAPPGAHDPAWRPDGLAVSFVSSAGGCSDVYTMALDGTGLTRVTDAACYPAPVEFAWAPDGTKLVFSGPACDFFDGCETDQIFSATVPGGPATALTGASLFQTDGHPAVSPDGAKIAFERWDWRGLVTQDIWVMNADGTGETRLTSGEADHSPSWWP
jgi:Tol biopolymer transport system component